MDSETIDQTTIGSGCPTECAAAECYSAPLAAGAAAVCGLQSARGQHCFRKAAGRTLLWRRKLRCGRRLQDLRAGLLPGVSVSTCGRPAATAAQVKSRSKPYQRLCVEVAWCQQAAYIACADDAWVHAATCICPHTHVQVQLDAAGNRVRCKRVGIMYSVWHWPAVRAMDIQRAAGKVPVTVEDVIRSRQETPTGAQ